jgi:tetratricopeptide (TPR) repeat protein
MKNIIFTFVILLSLFTIAHTQTSKEIEDYKFYLTQGQSFIIQEKYLDAISSLNNAISILPKIKNAYCLRGVAYDRLGEFSKAITDYTSAIKISPNDADIYMQRALSYRDMGNTEEACKDFHKADSLGNNMANVFIEGYCK